MSNPVSADAVGAAQPFASPAAPTSPAATPRPAPLAPVTAALALAMLLGLQPVTTDLYLPALPALTRDLGGGLADAQRTMSVLILSFGFGQLLWGPVADRFGRRPVLLIGLTLYVLASVAAALAHSMGAVVMLRGVQGIGLAASVVCARALVRDLYEPHEGMRVMSLGMSGMAFFAISSPIVGGWLAGSAGWRAALGCVAAISLAMLLFILLRLPETVPQRNRDALRPAALASTWWRILRNPCFQAYAGLTAGTYAGLFVFLSSSSFICLGVLGLSSLGYGALLVSSSLAYLLGTMVCRRWLLRVGAARAVQRAGFFTLVGGLTLAAGALAGLQTLWAVLLPQWLFAFGHGIHQPCGQAGAVSPFPKEAGAASALAGFILSATAFGVGSWLGHTMDGSTRAWGLGLGASSIVTATIAWTWVQWHGHVASQAPQAAAAAEAGRA